MPLLQPQEERPHGSLDFIRPRGVGAGAGLLLFSPVVVGPAPIARASGCVSLIHPTSLDPANGDNKDANEAVKPWNANLQTHAAQSWVEITDGKVRAAIFDAPSLKAPSKDGIANLALKRELRAKSLRITHLGDLWATLPILRFTNATDRFSPIISARSTIQLVRCANILAKLNWRVNPKVHMPYFVARPAQALAAVGHLALPRAGVHADQARRLYEACVVPQMLYGSLA